MYTLGINAAYHDPAACLVRDGRVIAAAEEERFTHIKHGKRPGPVLDLGAAVPRDRLLPAGGGDRAGRRGPRRLLVRPVPAARPAPRRRDDHAARWSRAPHPTPEEWEAAWDPLFLSSIVNAPRQLADGAPHHLQDAVPRASGPTARSAGTSSPHHLAHAASAFHASPFERAAVMTLDGRGEKATTGYAVGRGDRARMARAGPHAALARHPLRAGDRATSASCTRPTSTR